MDNTQMRAFFKKQAAPRCALRSDVIYRFGITCCGAFVCLMLLARCQWASAQSIANQRYTLSAGGSSFDKKITGNSYYIQQSIGQASVTGSHQSLSHIVHQGFIQPVARPKSDGGKSGKMVVYPNPFAETVSVTLPPAMQGKATIMLMDMLGRIFYKKEFFGESAITIAPGVLVSGCYMLYVVTDYTSYTKKLIKN